LQEKIAKKQAAKAAAGDGGQEQKGKNKKADKNAYTVFIK